MKIIFFWKNRENVNRSEEEERRWWEIGGGWLGGSNMVLVGGIIFVEVGRKCIFSGFIWFFVY